MPELDLGPFTAENEARICELVTGARRHGLFAGEIPARARMSHVRGVHVSAEATKS